MENEHIQLLERRVRELRIRAGAAAQKAQAAQEIADELAAHVAAYETTLTLEKQKVGSSDESQNSDMNVAGFIRDFVTEGGGATAAEIRQALVRSGKDVRPNYVYAVLNRAKSQKLIKKHGSKYYPDDRGVQRESAPHVEK